MTVKRYNITSVIIQVFGLCGFGVVLHAVAVLNN